MTTINGVTFNMRDLEVVATHRNIPNEVPGSDESFINDMGYAGLVLRMTGYETTLAKYDEVISEFMKSGAQTLVYRTGWQFSVYSTRLVPMLDIGIVDNWFPYEMIMITSTPYRESTTLSCRAKEITANNEEWSSEDIPCNNLLDNWSFEDWNAGPTSAPDDWSLTNQTIARNATYHKSGSYSAALTYVSSGSYLHQSVDNPTQYQGQTLTFGCWVNANSTPTVRLVLEDSVSSVTSTYHTGGITWQYLSVTKVIDSSATSITAKIEMSQTGNVYVDCAVVIESSSFLRDIETDGSVDAVPDIQVTSRTALVNVNQTSKDKVYNTNNSGSTVTITSSGNLNYVGPLTTFGQSFTCRSVGMGIIDSITINFAKSAAGSGTVRGDLYDKVGGNIIATKTITITDSWTGYTFTFDTPVAIGDFDPTCVVEQMLFQITTLTAGDLKYEQNTSDVYSGGTVYHGAVDQGYDLDFTVDGHSVKEIQQTFQVDKTTVINTVVLNVCKYLYAGSNTVSVIIKNGATTLGTGTAILSGSTFIDVEFELTEETTGSLTLAPSTTYTIHITPPSDSGNTTGILIATKTTNVYADGAVTLIENGDITRLQTHDLYFKLFFGYHVNGVTIYNIADTTIKCDISNIILEGATHRINIDGTGTIDYNDDFTTDKWRSDSTYSNITPDTIDNELDIADDGYIYWKCDSKGPVTGIPTLTTQINITSGIPTIQISADASTWYDITTAIVDDVDTVYELDSSSLHLKGLTEFYWRFDCVKAGAATASIKSFELDVNLVTIDFEHPVISASGVSTFRCDQDAASGMICEVALIYRDRSWPA